MVAKAGTEPPPPQALCHRSTFTPDSSGASGTEDLSPPTICIETRAHCHDVYASSVGHFCFAAVLAPASADDPAASLIVRGICTARGLALIMSTRGRPCMAARRSSVWRVHNGRASEGGSITTSSPMTALTHMMSYSSLKTLCICPRKKSQTWPNNEEL